MSEQDATWDEMDDHDDHDCQIAMESYAESLADYNAARKVEP